MGDPDQGIVHVIGPEQGRTHAGHDDRVRRLPHRDPRRVRCARLRHRHERGRARARHPDAPPGAAEVDVGHRRRRTPARRHRQGRDPRDPRRDRHRRRPRPRDRVPRLGDPGAVDGRPDDGLQHVDRSRRQGRADRPGRDDVRLPRRVATTLRRAPTGTPRSPTGSTLYSDDDAVWDKEVVLDAATITPHVTWGTNPGQVASIDTPIPDPASFDNPTTQETVAAGTRVHGPRARHVDARRQRRHRLHRLVHEQPDRGPAGRGRGDEGPHGHRAARDDRARQPRA